MDSTCTTGWEAMFCWKLSNRSSRFSSSSPNNTDIILSSENPDAKPFLPKILMPQSISAFENLRTVSCFRYVQCFYSPCTTRVAVVPDFSIRDSHAHSPVSYCRPAASTMEGVAEAFHLGYLVSFVC